jgi:hypothetical protein
MEATARLNLRRRSSMRSRVRRAGEAVLAAVLACLELTGVAPGRVCLPSVPTAASPRCPATTTSPASAPRPASSSPPSPEAERRVSAGRGLAGSYPRVRRGSPPLMPTPRKVDRMLMLAWKTRTCRGKVISWRFPGRQLVRPTSSHSLSSGRPHRIGELGRTARARRSQDSSSPTTITARRSARRSADSALAIRPGRG